MCSLAVLLLQAGGYIYEALGMRYVFVIGAAVVAVGWALVELWLRWATQHERAAAARAAAAEQQQLAVA